jgi:hypothetical protein
MPPSFGVNNLLLRNFLESVISPDSKSATGSQQIFGVTTTATLVLSFSPKSCLPNSSSFQVTNPKRPSFCWSMASSSSNAGSGCAVVPPKAPLSSVPSVFSQSLAFLFLYIPSSFFTLKPRLICLSRNLDPISLSSSMIILGSPS